MSSIERLEKLYQRMKDQTLDVAALKNEELPAGSSAAVVSSVSSLPVHAVLSRVHLLQVIENLRVSLQLEKIVVGMTGYPNVGKSSTINVLCGEKRVSVSATPGKTKHFQTLVLSPNLTLCDCPGLVFPSFVATKADLVANGILPIDQMRDWRNPANVVAQRVSHVVLNATYGLMLPPVFSGDDLLNHYASARGFRTAKNGQPDCSRAARLLLKDYIKGRLLFSHPPFDMTIDSDQQWLQTAHTFQDQYDNIELAALSQREGKEQAAEESDAIFDQLHQNETAKDPFDKQKTVQAFQVGGGKKHMKRNKRNFVRVERPYDATNLS